MGREDEAGEGLAPMKKRKVAAYAELYVFSITSVYTAVMH